MQVTNVAFWNNSTSLGGTGAITLVPGGSPTSASIQFTVPNLSSGITTLPTTTAVVVTASGLNSATTPDPQNTFTFESVAQVASLSYNQRDPASQAQNGPLTGGGALVINGSNFVQGSTVQFIDYGSLEKTVTVKASKVTVSGDGTRVSLALPNVSTTWSSDTTVHVNVVPPNGPSSFGPVNNAGGFTNQFTFFKSPSTKIKIKLKPAVVAAGPIYFVAYSQQGDRTGSLNGYQPLIMQVARPGTAGQNSGTWKPGTSMIKGANSVIDKGKYQALSFTTTKDANGYLTATVNYENLLYSRGYSNVSAGAVLSVGAFPYIRASGGLAGSPTVSDNPGLTYGLTELNVSGLATTNYSAPSSVVDISFVDQFGIPLQATPSPNAPFPVTTLGVTGGMTWQGAVNRFANFVKQSTDPRASAFAPLVSAGGATQVLAPKSYLTAVENQQGIKPLTSELLVPGASLQPPNKPVAATATGYFYWVTAVGDGGGETMLFGTGQSFTAPNTSGLYNTQFQTLDPNRNAVLVAWESFPGGVQSTAVSYNVYRQAGYTETSAAPQPISLSSVQKLSVPVTSLSYLDDGSGTWTDVPALPSSNATYSLLSGYFNDALNAFFTHYVPNEFRILRDGIVWKGRTVNGGSTGSVSFTYTTSSSTPSIPEKIYGRALLLTDAGNPSNQFVFLDPSSPVLTKNTWMQTKSNLGFSAGYQIFSACGAAGDGGPADAAGIGKAHPWKDLQNSIATAFDRGLATIFFVKPDAWANPPQFIAAAKVAQQAGNWSSGQLVPTTWAVTGVSNGVESVYGVVTSVAPQSGRAVKLKWSTAPTGEQLYDSFNVYRAKGSPEELLAWKQIATNVTVGSGAQTVAFYDSGLTGSPASPITYFAPGSTSDLYASFQHQIGSNGLAYGYGYDDQGSMSSTYTANGTPALTGYLNKLTVTGLRWGSVGNAKFGTATSKVVALTIAPLPQQVTAAGVASLTVSLQRMAQDSVSQAMFPAFGTNGWTVKVLSQPAGTKALPGLKAGTAAPVSFLNGQARVSLTNASPVSGTTYTLAFGLYDQTGKPVKNSQGRITATMTLTAY
jgi:hypothetical protein